MTILPSLSLKVLSTVRDPMHTGQGTPHVGLRRCGLRCMKAVLHALRLGRDSLSLTLIAAGHRVAVSTSSSHATHGRNVTRIKMTGCSTPVTICVWGTVSGAPDRYSLAVLIVP